jgi:hypothetical protein
MLLSTQSGYFGCTPVHTCVYYRSLTCWSAGSDVTHTAPALANDDRRILVHDSLSLRRSDTKERLLMILSCSFVNTVMKVWLKSWMGAGSWPQKWLRILSCSFVNTVMKVWLKSWMGGGNWPQKWLRITLQCGGIFMISLQTQGGKISHSFPGVSAVKQ